MPMIALCCLNGHVNEQYLHTWANLGCDTRVCGCGEALALALSVGRGLTYFEEGRPRVIENLGGARITSFRQHDQVMRARGVEMATEWHTSKRGTGWAHQVHPTSPAPPLVLPPVGGEL